MAGSPEDFIKMQAGQVGFDACRICRVDETWQAGDRLAEFVEAGHHANMDWMANTLARRKTPTAMWGDARSAIIVGLNYGPDSDPMAMLQRKSEGNISVYARGKDYHDLIKKRLKQMARAFVAETGAAVKVFVDTAPLMEKPLAQKAGLGWQGKHTNLVSRDLGSWLFLGVILTDQVLDADQDGEDSCGSCRACLDICPTDAFPAPYQLDARRCISYLTIEHKGAIPRAFRAAMGNRIYGCDDCLAVCPWNKFAQVSHEQAFWARAELKSPSLDELAGLDDATFRDVFSGSPIKRIGRNRFLRNVLIALANSGRIDWLETSVLPHLEDEDAGVRGAAVWALFCLDFDRFEVEKAARFDDESDAEVQAEWRMDNQVETEPGSVVG